jgi:radical SAM superfamily enzyme YgiQ (UPF0313 family)
MSTGRSDVFFVFPPAPGNAGAFKNHLGVAYLRAALARDGLATAQYLNGNPGTIDSVAADILQRKYPIVGFTVYDSNARLCIALAQSIKRQKPETQIVFGGPTPTFNARPLMERHPVIDACVMGEAEETAAHIFAKLLGGGGLDEAQPGIAFRKNGQVVCTVLPALVGATQPGVQGALDASPSPYLSGILADGQEGVLTGRGCTHHCQYCCFAALGRMSLRLHSIERVVAELEYIAARQKCTGKHYPVAILDDAFTLLPPRAKALCRAIADRKLNLALSCVTRADTVDEELIKLMREAGFGNICFGLESAVPHVLRATGKVRPPDWHDPDLEPERQFLERLRNSVLLAKKYGLKVAVSIILGLPTETPADAVETLRFVKELPVDSYAHNFLWVFPGTPLWTTHQKYGIGCTINEIGLHETTVYSYDVKSLKPGPKSGLKDDADLVRLLATDALYGCDSSSAMEKRIGAVILEAAELSQKIADWLQRILTVGGIVVQIYPQMKYGKWWRGLDRDRTALCEHLVPAQRYIQILPKDKNKYISGDENFEVVCVGLNLHRVLNSSLLPVRASEGANPLIAWAKGQEAKAEVCELSRYLRRPGKLVQIMDRIEAEDSPSPLQRMPVPPQVKYSGRWLRGKAPCMSLTRIEVSECGEVRTCRHGEPIGKVGDSRKVLLKRLAHLAGVVAKRRGCATCQNPRCPRCPFPGIDDRSYCQIMTTQERALRFLDWIRIYSRLPLLLASQRAN